MELFKISQNVNNGYDTYSSAIVCAKDKNEAQHSCLCGYHKFHHNKLWFQYSDGHEDSDGHEEEEECCSGWASAKNVKVEYIGEAKKGLEKGVVCASFHAG